MGEGRESQEPKLVRKGACGTGQVPGGTGARRDTEERRRSQWLGGPVRMCAVAEKLQSAPRSPCDRPRPHVLPDSPRTRPCPHSRPTSRPVHPFQRPLLIVLLLFPSRRRRTSRERPLRAIVNVFLRLAQWGTQRRAASTSLRKSPLDAFALLRIASAVKTFRSIEHAAGGQRGRVKSESS